MRVGEKSHSLVLITKGWDGLKKPCKSVLNKLESAPFYAVSRASF